MNTIGKIFILTFDYPPNNGGIARLAYELKKGLESKGFKITVIAPKKAGRDQEDDINVVRLSNRRGLLEFQTIKYLRKHADKKEDIVICGIFHPEGAISEILGLKTYILAHGAEYLPGNSFFRKKIWSFYRRKVLESADCLIANSHYTKSLVLSCSPRAKVVAVPLCVDIQYFYPSKPKYDDGKLHICTISRLEKFKAQDFIIKTIASLPNKYKERIHLHIGGKGSYKSKLIALVSENSLNDVVSFEGYIADDKLCDFYSSSHVFLLCTREEPGNRNVEGFGLVFVEAQACGTAVIGTRTGGIPDAIEEGNGGWLIGQNSYDELSSILMKLVDDKSLAISQGKKARRRIVDGMTWDKYIDRILEIIL